MPAGNVQQRSIGNRLRRRECGKDCCRRVFDWNGYRIRKVDLIGISRFDIPLDLFDRADVLRFGDVESQRVLRRMYGAYRRGLYYSLWRNRALKYASRMIEDKGPPVQA